MNDYTPNISYPCTTPVEMIKHIVTFKLKGTETERREAAEKFRDALLALPTEIEQLISMEVGVNCNPDELWDVVLTAVVKDMNDLEIYAKHPLHLEAASIIKDLKEDRACVDYEF